MKRCNKQYPIIFLETISIEKLKLSVIKIRHVDLLLMNKDIEYNMRYYITFRLLSLLIDIAI